MAMRDTLTGRWQLRICASFESSGLFVCLFVCLFVWGVNKASQEGALQRHPGIEY
jgi:hypothetical protein